MRGKVQAAHGAMASWRCQRQPNVKNWSPLPLAPSPGPSGRSLTAGTVGGVHARPRAGVASACTRSTPKGTPLCDSVRPEKERARRSTQ